MCWNNPTDKNRLRVAPPDVGGGFGPKLCVYREDVAVTAAAKLLKRVDARDSQNQRPRKRKVAKR